MSYEDDEKRPLRGKPPSHSALSTNTHAGSNIVTIASGIPSDSISTLSDTSGSIAVDGNIITMTNPPTSSVAKIQKELKRTKIGKEVEALNNNEENRDVGETTEIITSHSSHLTHLPVVNVNTKVPDAKAGRDIKTKTYVGIFITPESKYSTVTAAQISPANDVQNDKSISNLPDNPHYYYRFKTFDKVMHDINNETAISIKNY